MTRRQAKPRKPKAARQWRLPALPVARIVQVSVAVGIVLLCYHMSSVLLDKPIRAITVEGPFQRVSALQIEEAIADELGHGFLSADLNAIRERVAALPWIDQATVARRWPATLEIAVTEQVPAACWGESGLLNTRGELFVTSARHIPAELPKLSGPDGRSAEVAQRYLLIREKLIPLGLDVRRVHLDARGSWDITLQNGVEIRLGRRDIDDRTDLFIDVVANIIASRDTDIDFVDMRYNNGFSIGWHEDSNPQDDVERAQSGRSLVAGRSE